MEALLFANLARTFQTVRYSCMRIVIVEDNESVAKGIAYVLRDAGHALDMIHDGLQADAHLQG